jgi:hypothetical protein
LKAEALAAREEARTMPLGLERTEAMKKTGILRNAADLQPLFFAKTRENVSAYYDAAQGEANCGDVINDHRSRECGRNLSQRCD